MTNALLLPAVLCTDTNPPWLVFPQDGDSWTSRDIDRWILALAEDLGTTPVEVTRTAVTKGRAILERKRKRQAFQEQLEVEELFSNVSQIELIIRYEAHLDKIIDRALKQLELLQRARGGEMPPLPERIEVSLS